MFDFRQEEEPPPALVILTLQVTTPRPPTCPSPCTCWPGTPRYRGSARRSLTPSLERTGTGRSPQVTSARWSTSSSVWRRLSGDASIALKWLLTVGLDCTRVYPSYPASSGRIWLLVVKLFQLAPMSFSVNSYFIGTQRIFQIRILLTRTDFSRIILRREIPMPMFPSLVGLGTASVKSTNENRTQNCNQF